MSNRCVSTRVFERPSRRWLLVPVFVVLLLVVSACGTQSERAPTPSPTLPPQSSLTYNNLQLSETAPDGSLMWQLKAQRAERLDRDRSIALNGITGQLFDRRPGQSAGTGQRAIRIQAQSGRAMPESRRLELKDRVRAESSDFKVALEANEAVWLPEQHRLTAQGNVVVTQTERGVVLTGDRLQANLTANRLELRNDNPEKPIRARSDDPPLDLSVAELDWDLEKQQVNARGDAIVLHRDEKIRLQGETLTFLLPTNQLTLNGQVYVQSDAEGDRLWADRLDWVVGSETATATGNVRYEQPDRDVTVVGTAGTANWTTHTFAVEGPSTLTQLTLP